MRSLLPLSYVYRVAGNLKHSDVNRCNNFSYSRPTCWTFLITPRQSSSMKRTTTVFLPSSLQRVKQSRWEMVILVLALNALLLRLVASLVMNPLLQGKKERISNLEKHPWKYCYFVPGRRTFGKVCQYYCIVPHVITCSVVFVCSLKNLLWHKAMLKFGWVLC